MKKMNVGISSMVGVGLCAFILCDSGMAFGTTAQVTQATTCQPNLAGAQLEYLSWGGVGPTAANSDPWVECPAINFGSFASFPTFTAQINTINTTSNATTCFLLRYDTSLNLIGSSSVTIAANGGEVVSTFTQPSGSGGILMFECDLPYSPSGVLYINWTSLVTNE
jgi:hypothetical protein